MYTIIYINKNNCNLISFTNTTRDPPPPTHTPFQHRFSPNSGKSFHRSVEMKPVVKMNISTGSNLEPVVKINSIFQL